MNDVRYTPNTRQKNDIRENVDLKIKIAREAKAFK